MGEAKRKQEVMMNGYVPHCGNCSAWKRAAPMKPAGFCRANPPQMLLTVQEAPRMPHQPAQMVQVPQAVFPLTADTEWCRAHEPAVAPQIAAKEEIPQIDFEKLKLEPVEGSAN